MLFPYRSSLISPWLTGLSLSLSLSLSLTLYRWKLLYKSVTLAIPSETNFTNLNKSIQCIKYKFLTPRKTLTNCNVITWIFKSISICRLIQIIFSDFKYQSFEWEIRRWCSGKWKMLMCVFLAPCKSLLKRFIEEVEEQRAGLGLVQVMKPVLRCTSLKVGLEKL
jgi:hypothetical protein